MLLSFFSVAYSAQGGLHQQRLHVVESGRRLQGVLESFPVLNHLMSKIRARKTRDKIVLGCVIGFLLVFVYFWMRRK